MPGDGVVNFIKYSGRSYADIGELIDGIENGAIKRIKFPDGRVYDVSKVVLVSKDPQDNDDRNRRKIANIM